MIILLIKIGYRNKSGKVGKKFFPDFLHMMREKPAIADNVSARTSLVTHANGNPAETTFPNNYSTLTKLCMNQVYREDFLCNVSIYRLSLYFYTLNGIVIREAVEKVFLWEPSDLQSLFEICCILVTNIYILHRLLNVLGSGIYLHYC